MPTSVAQGINDEGQVVGFSNNGADETLSVIDLNALIILPLCLIAQ